MMRTTGITPGVRGEDTVLLVRESKEKVAVGMGVGFPASRHMSVHARSIMHRNLPEDIDSEETTSNDEL